MKKPVFAVLLSCFFIATLFPAAIQACTLWAASGDAVKGGGVLIAKNRDWQPDHTQYLQLIHPKKGFSYFGLFAEGNELSGLKAGVNEYGLVVISATASSIPKKDRKKIPREKELLKKLLTSCRTVDDVIRKKKWFIGPRFLMVADSRSVASIEIAPAGIFRVDRQENGVLTHTNHYLSPDLQRFNQRKVESSLRRADKIAELTKRSSRSFDMSDFIEISQDQSQGPDNSIWRTGEALKTRTLASWIVHLSNAGKPSLFVKLANPGQGEEHLHFLLPNVFRGCSKRFPHPKAVISDHID